MERIKTKLKFTKSNHSDSLVGFVSINPKNHRVKGVREDSKEPKKICIASTILAPLIELGVLYDVQMIPMRNASAGFIVVSAEPAAFEARIETVIVKNAVYQVKVKFGNKTILFDPMDGKRDSVRNMNGVIKVLESRKDIKNPMQVIDDFIKSGNIVLAHYQSDGYYVPSQAKVAQKA